MHVFLETERLALRRFTAADVDILVALDSDPAVMRFVSGGKATARDAIEHDILPAFLSYYDRFAGYGFWAAMEKSTGNFLGWFHFRPREGASPAPPTCRSSRSPIRRTSAAYPRPSGRAPATTDRLAIGD
jgi:RimJ/RimL family protein N-acetyltransferase